MPATKRKFAAPLGLLINSSSTVDSSVASTSPSTGAFVISGGVGIGGSLNVSNKSRFNDEVYINTNTNNSFYSAGHGGLAGNWTVGGNLQSGKYFLGLDLGLHPVGGNQSVVQTVWGMQLVGNSGVLPANYTASAVGANNAFGVLIPNQQAASVGLAVIGHASQTGDLQIWTTPSGLATTTYLAVKSNGQLYSYASIASTNTTTGALVVTGGVGVGGTLNIGADLSISGLTTLTYTSEKLNTKTSATGTVTHDLSTGSIFYHSSISNNFTANITNVPTTNDRAIGVTLVLAQGVTAYMSTALQIDGSAQTIKWVNNTTPTGTASKVDIVGFSLIRTGSAWTVLGQYSTYG